MAQQGQAQGQAPYAIEHGDTVELGRVYALSIGGRELIYHGDVNRMTRALKATIYRHTLVAVGRYEADEIADADADLLADAFDRTAYCRRDDYSYSVATCTELATGTARKTHDYNYSQGGGVVDLGTVTVVEVRAGQIVEPAPKSDEPGESSRPATDDEREEIDAVGANGLWSAEKGDSSHGDLFVAISYGTMFTATYGYEENGYGQRCYYVFADDSAAQAWFDGIETGPALTDSEDEDDADDEDDELVMVSDQDYDAFRRGYVSTMLEVNTLVGGETEDVAYQYQTPGSWWLDTPVDLADADAFLRDNLDDLHSAGDADMVRHGEDFALTRNRHGAGFWDRGYGDVGDRLTEAAHAYGEATVDLPADEDEDDEDEPTTRIDPVDGHEYVVTYGRDRELHYEGCHHASHDDGTYPAFHASSAL